MMIMALNKTTLYKLVLLSGHGLSGSIHTPRGMGGCSVGFLSVSRVLVLGLVVLVGWVWVLRVGVFWYMHSRLHGQDAVLVSVV